MANLLLFVNKVFSKNVRIPAESTAAIIQHFGTGLSICLHLAMEDLERIGFAVVNLIWRQWLNSTAFVSPAKCVIYECSSSWYPETQLSPGRRLS